MYIPPSRVAQWYELNGFLPSDLKLGLLGVTFMYASVDYGVAGSDYVCCLLCA